MGNTCRKKDGVARIIANFAAPKTNCNESIVDNTSARRVERVHDIRMVRASEASGNEDFDKLAPDTGHTFLMGNSIF